MILRKMRIGTRLSLGFGSVLAIMIAVSVSGTLLFQKSRNELTAVHEAASAKENLAADMKSTELEMSAVMRNTGAHSEIKLMQADEDRARVLEEKFNKAFEQMSKLSNDAAEREVMDAVAKLDKQLDDPFKQALGLA